MGSGNDTYVFISAISGQSGGRIFPGGASERVRIPHKTQSDKEAWELETQSLLNHFIGSKGGGAGQAGELGGEPLLELRPDLQLPGNIHFRVHRTTGGGGGWGAKGGDGAPYIQNNEVVKPPPPGGAGGKAIDTQGHAVTWLGGSDRAFGVVG